MFAMQGRAKIGVGFAARGDAGEIEFRGWRQQHFDVSVSRMNVHLRNRKLARAKFDIAAFDRNFHRIGEVADVDVTRSCIQAHRTYQIGSREIAQRHAHRAGKLLDIQVGLLPIEAQRLGYVAELDDTGIGARDGDLAIDILQFDIGAVSL